MSKLLCRVFGHRWRMLGWDQVDPVNDAPTTRTGWQCDRCGERDVQQWDW